MQVAAHTPALGDSRVAGLRVVRGSLLWQALGAVLCFALPFGLLLLQRPTAPSFAAWERVDSFPGDRMVRRVVVRGTEDGQVLYATGTVSGVHMSTNGGRDWLRADMPLPHNRLGVVQIVDLAVNPDDPNEIYAVVAAMATKPRPMVYWSDNGGRTWRVRGGLGPRRVTGMAFGPTGDDLYMATTGGIFRAFVFDDGQRRFVGDEDDLRRAQVGSLDGPARVTALAIGAPSMAERAGAQAAPTRSDEIRPSLVLYVGTADRGLEVFVDDPVDGPQSVPVGNEPLSLYVRERAAIHTVCIHPLSPEIVCVGTDRGIWASSDAGRSWFRTAYDLRSHKVLSLLIDPSDAALYAGVAGGGVFCSKDDAATWQSLGKGLARTSVLSLAIGGSGERILYAGTNSGLWRLLLPTVASAAAE